MALTGMGAPAVAAPDTSPLKAPAAPAPPAPPVTDAALEPVPEPVPFAPAPGDEVAAADAAGTPIIPEGAPAALTVAALVPATGANGAASGNRGAASMVSHSLSDAAVLGWNPTNGNIVLTGDLLRLKGVSRDMEVKWRYNSLNDVRPTLSVGTQEAGVRADASNNITYTAADGGEYTFVPNGSGGWTAPPGLNASIRSFDPFTVTIRFNDTGNSNQYIKSGAVYVLRNEDDPYSDLPNRASSAKTARPSTPTTPGATRPHGEPRLRPTHGPTPAATTTPPATASNSVPATTTPSVDASRNWTPPGRKPTPTSTQAVTPST
nr:hypothetical protein [Arthrobacter sp. FB24]